MDRKEIEKKVKECIVKQVKLPIENITLESNLIDDLGLDSLDSVELIMELEENFDIVICEEAAEKVNTVRDVIDAVETELKKLEK